MSRKYKFRANSQLYFVSFATGTAFAKATVTSRKLFVAILQGIPMQAQRRIILHYIFSHASFHLQDEISSVSH